MRASAASGSPWKKNQSVSAAGMRVERSSVLVARSWNEASPEPRPRRTCSVPGGGQLVSARKPVLRSLALRPSVSTGGSASMPFETSSSVRSKKRSSSGCQLGALGLWCAPWNM